MSDKADTMELWNSVCKTDPRNTKAISLGSRRFTAVDAYAQIQRATELWGPVGRAWWWETETDIQGDRMFMKFRLYHPSLALDQAAVVEIRNAISLVDSKGRFDHDAPKKLLTDSLTKALSYLGFNADIFLGLFDDSKYVAERRQDVEAKERGDDPAERDGLLTDIGSAFQNAGLTWEGGEASQIRIVQLWKECFGKTAWPLIKVLPNDKLKSGLAKLEGSLNGGTC